MPPTRRHPCARSSRARGLARPRQRTSPAQAGARGGSGARRRRSERRSTPRTTRAGGSSEGAAKAGAVLVSLPRVRARRNARASEGGARAAKGRRRRDGPLSRRAPRSPGPSPARQGVLAPTPSVSSTGPTSSSTRRRRKRVYGAHAAPEVVESHGACLRVRTPGGRSPELSSTARTPRPSHSGWATKKSAMRSRRPGGYRSNRRRGTPRRRPVCRPMQRCALGSGRAASAGGGSRTLLHVACESRVKAVVFILVDDDQPEIAVGLLFETAEQVRELVRSADSREDEVDRWSGRLLRLREQGVVDAVLHVLEPVQP